MKKVSLTAILVLTIVILNSCQSPVTLTSWKSPTDQTKVTVTNQSL